MKLKFQVEAQCGVSGHLRPKSQMRRWESAGVVDHLAFTASASSKDDQPRSRKFYYWPTLIDRKLFLSQDKKKKKSHTVTSTYLSYHITLHSFDAQL